jgi:hypothetical protein
VLGIGSQYVVRTDPCNPVMVLQGTVVTATRILKQWQVPSTALHTCGTQQHAVWLRSPWRGKTIRNVDRRFNACRLSGAVTATDKPRLAYLCKPGYEYAPYVGTPWFVRQRSHSKSFCTSRKLGTAGFSIRKACYTHLADCIFETTDRPSRSFANLQHKYRRS